MVHKLVKTAILFCALVTGVNAQTQTKEWKESFNVNDDVTVDVNTMNTDVVFETWSQNKVEVVATMEIEGISKEEAEAYFKNWDFEAMGNSSRVEVRSGGGMLAFGNSNVSYSYSMNVGMPTAGIDVPDPALTPVPPVPTKVLNQLGNVQFDYDAFQKDAEKYMKQFQKQFSENFDNKELQAELEKWRAELATARKAALDSRREALEASMEARKSAYEATRERLMNARDTGGQEQSSSYTSYRTSTNEKGESEITIQKNGKTIHLKIKKSIKVKMPKNSGLKLNVRHGEVKLASQTKNINATLAYARLLANEVNGNNTVIETSYAPVQITRWNSGKLIVNFSGDVDIKTANNIELIANSSDVLIEQLLNKADVNAKFGTIRFSNVASGFASLNLRLNNMDTFLDVPETAYQVRLNLNNISLDLPKDWKITKGGQVIEGYHLTKDTSKMINVSGLYNRVQFL
ncbi:hypothetical protein [Pustulibacterium marinum]|nr:hypothetical protein [Pustulibacterium marinum]